MGARARRVGRCRWHASPPTRRPLRRCTFRRLQRDGRHRAGAPSPATRPSASTRASTSPSRWATWIAPGASASAAPTRASSAPTRTDPAATRVAADRPLARGHPWRLSVLQGRARMPVGAVRGHPVAAVGAAGPGPDRRSERFVAIHSGCGATGPGRANRVQSASETVCKPSPVPPLARRRRSSIWDRGYPRPRAADPRTERRRPTHARPGAPCRSSYLALHRVELARFTRSSGRAARPIRHCGAGPRLTADGCYPLPCVGELGLSS